MLLSDQPTVSGLRAGWRQVTSFGSAEHCDPAIQARLAIQQAERLRLYLPQLCLIVSLCTVIATVALRGDLPWYLQFGPPMLILIVCGLLYLRWRVSDPVTTFEQAASTSKEAPKLAAVLGAIAAFWCVNAFSETEQYYCLVAPVFLSMSVMMAANCLDSVPRAALVLIITASAPVMVRLSMYDNLTLSSVALLLFVCGFMQLRLIYAKYAETIRSLELQDGIERLARTDSLTGLANRRSFDEGLTDLLIDRQQGATLLALDLDGFKQANDAYGHDAGDAILIEVARRLQTLCPTAVRLARIGGDEFAVLLSPAMDDDALPPMILSIRSMLSLPIELREGSVSVAASIGFATAGPGEVVPGELLRDADRMLYLDKRVQKGTREKALQVA